VAKRPKKKPSPAVEEEEDVLISSIDKLLVDLENESVVAARWHSCDDEMNGNLATLRWVLANTVDGGWVVAGLNQKQREYLIFASSRCVYRFARGLTLLAIRHRRYNHKFEEWDRADSYLKEIHDVMSHVGDCENLVCMESTFIEDIFPEAVAEMLTFMSIVRYSLESNFNAR